MKELEVLRSVQALILRHGWRTIGASAAPGVSCLTMCVFATSFSWPEKRRAMRALEASAGTSFLTTWCDVPGRSEAEVLGVVGKAIGALEAFAGKVQGEGRVRSA